MRSSEAKLYVEWHKHINWVAIEDDYSRLKKIINLGFLLIVLSIFALLFFFFALSTSAIQTSKLATY